MTLSTLRTWLPLLMAGAAMGVAVYGVSTDEKPGPPGRDQQALAPAEPPGERARRIAAETRRLEAPETVDDDWQEVETKRIIIKR